MTTTTDFSLGTRVRIIDRMLRIHTKYHYGPKSLKRIQELWPSTIVQEAIKMGGYPCRLWVPALVVKQLEDEHLYVTVNDRYQTGKLKEEPRTGIVTRKVVLHGGVAEHGDEYGGSHYERFRDSITGYEVTYSLNRRPVTVMEDQIVRLETPGIHIKNDGTSYMINQEGERVA